MSRGLNLGGSWWHGALRFPGPRAASLHAEIVSGDGQSADPCTALPDPLVVVVRDECGDPVTGVVVHWWGSWQGGEELTSTATDADGVATLPGPTTPDPGNWTVDGYLDDGLGVACTFTLQGNAVAHLHVTAGGDGLEARLGEPFGHWLIVTAHDGNDELRVGAQIDFTPPGTEPTAICVASDITDANGRAMVYPDAGFVVGQYDVSAQVHDGGNVVTFHDLHNLANPDLYVAQAALPPGQVGVPYSTQLAACNGTPPYSYTKAVEGGPLPAGLELASSGAITGTPTTAGDGQFSPVVTDAAEQSVGRFVTWSIAPA